MSRYRSKLLLFSYFLLSVFELSCTQKSSQNNPNLVQDDFIVIGEVASMTGIEATYGLGAHRGISLAVDEVNASGGVLGKKLKLLTLDSQGKPDESARAITRLISQDHASVVLTGVISSNALAMAPIAQQNQVPLIATIATHPKVTELGNYIFRICLMDNFQGQMMAKFASNHLKLKKIAILRDIKSDYSVGLADTFTSVLKQSGGEVIIDQKYSAGDIDFKSQLTAVRAKNPEAIYIPGYYTDVSLIARQARELGLQVPLLGGDGWDSPKLKEIGGKALKGSYFSGMYSPESPSPKLHEFLTHYQSLYHSVPDGLTVMGYEGVQVLVHAMKKAKALDSISIREALASSVAVETLTGTVAMDSKRNARRSAVVMMIQEDGSLKFQTSVQPE